MVPVKTNQNWLPSIFNDFFDNEWMARANATAPAINVIENEKDYKVELAAPGMTKNDFKVSVDESNNLVICMEKKDEKKAKCTGYLCSWRHAGTGICAGYECQPIYLETAVLHVPHECEQASASA